MKITMVIVVSKSRFYGGVRFHYVYGHTSWEDDPPRTPPHHFDFSNHFFPTFIVLTFFEVLATSDLQTSKK